MKSLIFLALLSLVIIFSVAIYCNETGDDRPAIMAYEFGMIFLFALFTLITEIADKDN